MAGKLKDSTVAAARGRAPGRVDLVEIGRDGSLSEAAGPLPDVARSAIDSTVQLYSRSGWTRPWIGYLGFRDGEYVGTCAFKSAPAPGRDGRRR